MSIAELAPAISLIGENNLSALKTELISMGKKLSPDSLETLFNTALKLEHFDICDFLIKDHKVDVNMKSGYMLRDAFFMSTEVVKFLLKNGACPNAYSSTDTRTCLDHAVWASGPETISLLLAHGARPHMTDKKTATILFSKNEKIFTQLLPYYSSHELKTLAVGNSNSKFSDLYTDYETKATLRKKMQDTFSSEDK